MPPSEVGANRLAGQAVTQARVVHDRQISESTMMWARTPIRKSTVAIRSSKEMPRHGGGSAPLPLTGVDSLIRRS